MELYETSSGHKVYSISRSRGLGGVFGRRGYYEIVIKLKYAPLYYVINKDYEYVPFLDGKISFFRVGTKDYIVIHQCTERSTYADNWFALIPDASGRNNLAPAEWKW